MTISAMKQALEALEKELNGKAHNILFAAIKAQEKCEPVLDYTVLHQYADDYSLNYNDLCVMVRSAITHPAPAPAGWQLVPVEPTDAMIRASHDLASVVTYSNGQHTHIPIAYKAMLQAAPKGGMK